VPQTGEETMTTTTIRTQSTATATGAGEARYAQHGRELVWAGFRAVVGFLFACHGAQGMFGAFGGIDGAGAAVPALSLGWFSSLICLVGGVLVMAGLWTRSAAVLCSGSMAFAYFVVHQPMGALPLQNMGEPAALYAWAFLVIAVLGPGRYALDSLVRRS
jgi:putative oxidoreductase